MAFTPTIRGTNEPVLQKQTWSVDNNSGTYAEDWKGLNLSKMATKFNGVQYVCKSAHLSYANGVSELQITWGNAGGGTSSAGNTSSLEITVDRWEFPEPTIQTPIFDHPTFVYYMKVRIAYEETIPLASVTDALFTKYMSAWMRAVSASAHFPDFIPDWAAFESAHPTEAGFMARCYAKVVAGQTHFQDSLYSVRHTTRAPAYWSRNVADNNINSIYSHARLISELTDGSLWIFPLPGRLQYKAAAAVSALTARLPARGSYQIGWLKSASGETSIHDGSIEIATGYVLYQWSTDLYPLVS